MYEARGGSAKHLYIEKSKGRSYPLNLGIRSSKTDFVLIVDDDDYLAPNCLDAMIATLREHSWISAVAVHTQVVFEDIVGDAIRQIKFGDKFMPRIESFRPENLFITNPAPIHSIMARRTAMMRVGLFPENIEYTEDWCFWFRFSLSNHFAVIPKILAFYCQRPRGIAEYQNTILPMEMNLHALYRERWRMQYLRSQGLLNSLIHEAINRIALNEINARPAYLRVILWHLRRLLGNLRTSFTKRLNVISRRRTH